MKAHNEKKTILNIPTAFDDDPKKRKKMDEDFIIDAFEKMRDYIAQELKKVKDDMFKQHIEFETKVREKIDKKELEEIEKRIMENVELSVTNRTKKYVDKTDMKKIKASLDKQIENLFALI
mmetsp:Transcript_14528/g.14135  ORF Transcript_14528/g.14135 Transcript_14528/m.14135 type:complete len:121 (+) Transcript_14528:1634-1996(+)